MIQPAKRPTATICLSPYAGGMERDAIAIAKNMATLALNSVLIVRTGTWLHQKAQESGVTVEPIRMRTHVSFSGAMQLRRLWKKYEIGNIVFLGSSEMPTIFLSLLGLDMNFIVRHGTTKHRTKKDLIHQLTWSKVKSHWCISRHLKRNVENIFPTRNKIIFTAYTNQEYKFSLIPVAGSLKKENSLTRFLYIGRLQGSKGVDQALRIIAGLKKIGKNIELTIVGDGPKKNQYELLSEQLGVSSVVRFAGEVSEPYDFFGDSDIFLFPSKGEGLPNAFIEALYSGIPCFVYKNTVFPELYDLGMLFFFLPGDCLDAQINVVADYLENNLERPIIGNRKLVQSVFSKKSEDVIVSRYLID